MPFIPSPPQPPDESAGSDEPMDLSSLVEVAGRVAETLPAGSPMTWRRLTYRAVLSAIARDRVENSTGDLEDGDEASLADLVRAAAQAAGRAPLEHRDDAYELVLQALLEDWVENWEGSGADDNDG